METVKNLVLDFGGVLLDLDEQATYQAFVRLGLKCVPKDLASANLDFQRGKLSEEQFVGYLKRYLPPEISHDQVRDAWCAMLGQVPERRWELLRELARSYRLFLLSNTDDIHLARLGKTMDLEGFERLFERVYYSPRTGLRKPEPAIFKMLLSENGLRADQTLFIDDTQENILGAQAVGMQAIWLDLNNRRLEDLPLLPYPHS